jgi:hypothetical protein
MTCPICLSEYEREARIDCGHTFHYSCIGKWCDLNPNCPLCKCNVTEIRTQFAIKYVRPPVISFDATIAGYLYGPQRRAHYTVPYEQQRDLTGFVRQASTDEILAHEGFTSDGREEVPFLSHLSQSDRLPVSSRTRSRESKHTV